MTGAEERKEMNKNLKEIETQIQKSESLTNIVIYDQIDYEKASTLGKGLRELKKTILSTFDPIVEKTRAAWKESIAQKDKYLNPIEHCIEIVDGKIKNYLALKEKERQEAELKLRQEAEEKARKEKEKLEARAEKWNEKGNTEKASDLTEQAEQVEAVVPLVSPNVQKINGQSVRKLWYAEIIDFSILPEKYKLPDITTLNQIARNENLRRENIPGVIFKSKDCITMK